MTSKKKHLREFKEDAEKGTDKAKELKKDLEGTKRKIEDLQQLHKELKSIQSEIDSENLQSAIENASIEKAEQEKRGRELQTERDKLLKHCEEQAGEMDKRQKRLKGQMDRIEERAAQTDESGKGVGFDKILKEIHTDAEQSALLASQYRLCIAQLKSISN